MTTQRRTDILTEAANLFAQRGFAAVGVTDIGKRVGISGGAIYRHFANKDALLQELLLATDDEWLAMAAETATIPAPDRLAALVDRAVQLVAQRPGELATFMRERHRADKATARVLVEKERTLAALWRAAILTVQSDLSEKDDELRQRAINGVMSSLARRPAQLAHPRFRALVGDGLIGLCALPPGRFEGSSRAQGWGPPAARRREILVAAAALFRRLGFHGVGIDDIGEAAGISGPAVYEHFGSKAAILIDLYDLAGALVVAGNEHALLAPTSPEHALTSLIRSIVHTTFGWTDAMIVTGQEGHALPESERRRLTRRRHEIYQVWISVVRAVRPNLSPSEARALVLAILPMVGHVAVHAQPSVLSVDATVDIVKAFLLGSKYPTSSKEPS